MAAIPDTGGAGYAPRGVMCARVTRALVRLAVLGALVTVGWLLGSGTSHADEDLGQPGTGLIHVLNTTASSDEGSGDQLGIPHSLRPTVKNVLSSASAARLSAQPPVKVRILRPIVNAVDVTKPLTQALTPVSQPLAGTAPQPTAAQSPVPADQLAPALAIAAPIPAAPVHTAVRDAAPAVALSAPAHPAADPMTVPVAIGDGPVAPMPASPPGSTTSPCVIGGTGGGTSAKGASDVAVRDGWAMGSLVQPHGLRAGDTSDLPGSLSAQPSTSPD